MRQLHQTLIIDGKILTGEILNQTPVRNVSRTGMRAVLKNLLCDLINSLWPRLLSTTVFYWFLLAAVLDESKRNSDYPLNDLRNSHCRLCYPVILLGRYEWLHSFPFWKKPKRRNGDGGLWSWESGTCFTLTNYIKKM